MCGICGQISYQKIIVDKLKRMNDTMSHRGPDDSGVQIFQDGYRYIGLGHRRLSIQDLSPLGHQPMCSYDKSVWIVFNGEIYNFKELKKNLSDYPFQSETDTEVILALYNKEGIKCLEKLNGMFALAIYDRKCKKLFLARDRMGKKPLYYYFEAGECIFASELKAFFSCEEFKKKIDKDVVKSYLFHGYIKSPFTILKGVKKVKPGSYLEISEQRISVKQYWDINRIYREVSKTSINSYNSAKELLKNILEKAVGYRLIADVPIGSFLSGGYDSSLITAVAQKYTSSPLKTFSIGFNEDEYNEAPYAKEVARYLGTDHTEYYVQENEVLRMIDTLTYYYDEPFADSSQIPSMLVAELASKKVKAVLSGDGGDELFCGYDLYKIINLGRKLNWLEPFWSRCLTGSSRTNKIIKEKMPESIKGMFKRSNNNYKVQFLNENRREFCDYLMGNEEDVFFEEELNLPDISDWKMRRMLLDMQVYLPDDILCKVDRATMKYGLEARCPLLDKNVVELSFAIPMKYKYKNKSGKYILKDIAHEYIPKPLLDRPKKGFCVPVNQWVHTVLKEELIYFTSESFIEKQGIFEKENIKKAMDYFWKDDWTHAEKYVWSIWHLYVFQRWYQNFFMGN